jgi:hypothetical protein
MGNPSFPQPDTNSLPCPTPSINRKALICGDPPADAHSNVFYFGTKFAPTPLRVKLSVPESGP